MRKRIVVLAVAVMVLCLAAEAETLTRSFVPGDTYVECIAYRQLGADDDFPGMWEYVYDVVASTDDSGQNYTWTEDVRVIGFDGTQIANQYYSQRAGYVGLTQRWDDHTTKGPVFWGGYQLRTEYPSYWDEVSPGLSEWVLPLAADPNAAWGMINQWHSGDDYALEWSLWDQPGIADAGGVTWQPTSKLYAPQGLLLTFRVVHPESPGEIKWSTHYSGTSAADAMTVVGTTIGPIPEPATVSLLALGACLPLFCRKRR